jgi:hypothetical protein
MHLIRSGILIAAASSMVACALPEKPAVSCVGHDDSLFAAYDVSECVSGSDEHDAHQEACALTVKSEHKPAPPVGWERKPITFAPLVVRELAEKRDIQIAILYSLGEAQQFYGDDDLSHAIVYRGATSCEGK